jgi:ketol-acid reductoisomerase
MEAFDDFDISGRMRELLEAIRSGSFADEWDAERDAGYPRLEELRSVYAGPELAAWEREFRTVLGEGVVSP